MHKNLFKQASSLHPEIRKNAFSRAFIYTILCSAAPGPAGSLPLGASIPWASRSPTPLKETQPHPTCLMQPGCLARKAGSLPTRPPQGGRRSDQQAQGSPAGPPPAQGTATRFREGGLKSGSLSAFCLWLSLHFQTRIIHLSL